ncbi:hypothetical protein [Krasilnikovia cinnamomea]|nr:hypothetical protein [Krasilnikovia cinnamomea]
MQQLAEAVGVVTAPAAGLAALGLYFGWKRTQTYATYFGVDNSVLGFSLQEYVLRSASSVFVIVFSTVAAGLAALTLHQVLTRHAGPAMYRLGGTAFAVIGVVLVLVWADAPVNRMLGGLSPTIQLCAGAVGGLVVVAGGAAISWGGTPTIGRPARSGRTARVLCTAAAGIVVLDGLAGQAGPFLLGKPYIAKETVLAAAVTVLLYAAYLRHDLRRADVTTPPWARALFIVLTALLVAAGLFAATDRYAATVGIREAELTVARLDGRRGVVVYTKENPQFPASVTCTPLPAKDAAFKYRCEGLRLFLRTKDEVLAFTANWSRDDGIDSDDRLIVIRADDSVRLEFTPGEEDLPVRPLVSR